VKSAIMRERYYKIGEVSEILGMEQHTLRYLENSLKLKIKRDERGDRLYDESDIETFKLILQLKEKGLNTTAIKMALENIEETQEMNIAARDSQFNREIVEMVSVAKKIVEQNEELLQQNKRLEQRLERLEQKIEQRNEEREKKVDEFLRLWRNEQESKSKSWISKLWGK